MRQEAFSAEIRSLLGSLQDSYKGTYIKTCFLYFLLL